MIFFFFDVIEGGVSIRWWLSLNGAWMISPADDN